MYCPKCGLQNAEGNSFCTKCGTALVQTTAVSPRPVEAVRNSGMAIASLVLGIAGIFINFLSILAIIFGAVAMSQINKNPNLKGKGMAVAGLILGIVIAVVWVIILIWVGTAFWWAASYY